MDECIICNDISEGIICEECQAFYDIDMSKSFNIKDFNFVRRLEDGFAILEAAEKPVNYFWS